MRSRLPVFVLAGAAVIAAVAAFSSIRMKRECRALSCISFRDKDRFMEENVYENSPKAYRAWWSAGRLGLRIEKYVNIGAEQARSYNDYKSMQVSSLYEDAKSPYPGILSDRIKCEGKYKPVFEKKKAGELDLLVYSGYLNDRLQYGICIRDQLAYKSLAAMFYCAEQKSWYQAEFIAPLDLDPSPDLESMARSIRCISR